MGKLVGYKYVIVFKGAFRGIRRAREDAIKFADKLAHANRNVWDKVTILECSKDGSMKVMYEVTAGQLKAKKAKTVPVKVARKMKFRVK
ncbi:hypothetical protein M0R72_05695 [Candidatus Pacearchaeota archaeon]|jgi:hypothetical protein|nr:hypothetical protein [Candidatus Pacearchaeota archaeon]